MCSWLSSALLSPRGAFDPTQGEGVGFSCPIATTVEIKAWVVVGLWWLADVFSFFLGGVLRV